MITARNTKPEEWVTIEKVLEELKMKKKTFQNKKSGKNFPHYAVRTQGIKTVFHLPTLKGLTN